MEHIYFEAQLCSEIATLKETPNKKKTHTHTKTKKIEVRDSRTGYLLPARDGPGALPDVESSWAKYEEMYTFSKMDMSEISRNVNLSEIKAPAGAS